MRRAAREFVLCSVVAAVLLFLTVPGTERIGKTSPDFIFGTCLIAPIFGIILFVVYRFLRFALVSPPKIQIYRPH